LPLPLFHLPFQLTPSTTAPLSLFLNILGDSIGEFGNNYLVDNDETDNLDSEINYEDELSFLFVKEDIGKDEKHNVGAFKKEKLVKEKEGKKEKSLISDKKSSDSIYLVEDSNSSQEISSEILGKNVSSLINPSTYLSLSKNESKNVFWRIIQLVSKV
jgi:hypothetical protein